MRITTMPPWLSHLMSGLTCRPSEDRLGSGGKPPPMRESLRPAWPHVRAHWRWAAGGTALLAVSQAVGLPLPLVQRFLVDRVILDRELALLAPALAAWITLGGIAWLAGLVEGYAFAQFQQRTTLALQQSLLARTLHFPKAFFDRTGPGYLMSRLTSDIQGMEWFFSASIVQLLTQAMRLVGGIAFLFYLEWRLAIPAIAAIPLAWLSMGFFARRMYAINHRQQEQEAIVSGRLQEALAAAPLLKAFAAEDRAAARIGDALHRRFLIRLEQLLVGSLSGVTNNLGFALVRLLVLALGACWVIQGHWSLGSLLAFQAYLGYVFGPTMFLADCQRMLQVSRASLDRVGALFAILPEPDPGAGRPVPRLRGGISLHGIRFSYDGRTPVLDGLSLAIQAGERVAIVGHSGVGKTTLINLIMQFYRPQAGEVRFDGEPAASYDLAALRRRIGHVAQDNLLLGGTVLDNLRLGRPDASRAEAQAAAEAARIHPFIASLADGYDSEIGERGVALSEGQRQRLCIARALVGDPDILILDEPTSALDAGTETSLLEKLLPVAAGKTLIIIAHRLETIRRVSRVILLADGGIAADGPPDELARDNPAFRAVFPPRDEEAGP